MSPEQWQEVKEILAETLELPAGQRAALLDTRCREQPELRREVEALLAAAEGEGFLDQAPPLPPPALASGEILGPYQIEHKLAEGGMGEVFQALDTRLERRVAIKVLPAHLSASDTAIQRFERETKALAALSHPNILSIFDVGRGAGTTFAVTELLSGTTLRDRLAGGALPIAEAVALAAQTARGLAAAHAVGIVHRDLKPENLFITRDGQLKILDFGIATFSPPQLATTVATLSLTQENAIVGTVGYMSPEQAQGKRCDTRSDVFSLGAVLYEMLTGVPAFRGETPMATLIAVVEHEPARLETLCPAASDALVELVGRCLAKDPSRRFSSASELAAALAALGETAATTPGAPPRPARRRRWLAAALSAVLGVAGGGAALWVWRAPEPQRQRSIAVLPFANLSGDPANEYFSEGLSEELLGALAKLPQLRVCSRTSAFALAGQQLDVATIGAKLGVAHVLEGSVRQAGRRVRVSAQLIEVATDSHLWSEVYDRELDDVFAIQNEIARSVAAALAVRLVGQSMPPSARRPADIEVYNLYLQGRYFARRATRESFDRAIDYLRRALELDPGYAVAWAGLAEVHFGRGAFVPDGREQSFTLARQEAQRALALDPDLAEAHAVLGGVKGYYERDWVAAKPLFQKALELEPGNVNALLMLAMNNAVAGHFDEALALDRRAVALDPLNVLAHMHLGHHARAAGHLEEAEAAYRKRLELDQDAVGGHVHLGLVYLAQGKPELALLELQREIEPGRRRFGLAIAYDALGRHQEADAALAELIAEDRETSAALIAGIYAERGQREKAFEWLDLSLAQNDPRLLALKLEPMFANLHDDPRFAVLLRKLGLPS